VKTLAAGEQKKSSKCFPFRAIFQIEINFQFQCAYLLTQLLIGGRLSAFSLLKLNTFQKMIVKIPIFFVSDMQETDLI
jgi:hypothetical protein